MADKREETPDILGDVLGAEGTEEVTEQATKTPDDTTDEQGREEASGSSEQEGGNPSNNSGEVPKRKATYYLHEDTLSKLEEVWFQLRQRADEGEKRKVSKSAIVEAAIEMAADEFDAERKGSELAQTLLE